MGSDEPDHGPTRLNGWIGGDLQCQNRPVTGGKPQGLQAADVRMPQGQAVHDAADLRIGVVVDQVQRRLFLVVSNQNGHLVTQGLETVNQLIISIGGDEPVLGINHRQPGLAD